MPFPQRPSVVVVVVGWHALTVVVVVDDVGVVVVAPTLVVVVAVVVVIVGVATHAHALHSSPAPGVMQSRRRSNGVAGRRNVAHHRRRG